MTARERETRFATTQWDTLPGNGEREKWKEILEDFFEIQEAPLRESSPLGLDSEDPGLYYDLMGWFSLEPGFSVGFTLPGFERVFAPVSAKPVLPDRSFVPYFWEWGSLRYDIPGGAA